MVNEVYCTLRGIACFSLYKLGTPVLSSIKLSVLCFKTIVMSEKKWMMMNSA